MATATPTTKPQVKPTAAPKPPAKATPLKTPVDVFALLMGDAKTDFVVHLQTCKSYKAQKAKSNYAGLPDYAIPGIVNQYQVITEVWDDQITETRAADEDLTDEAKAEDPTWGWLAKNGYVHSVSFHSCLNGLPQSSKAAGTKAETVKKATKTELATRIAEAAASVLNAIFDPDAGDPEFLKNVLATFETEEAARQCVAQWLHGMPTDRSRFTKVLPVPDRSDWHAWARQMGTTGDKPADTTTDTTTDTTA